METIHGIADKFFLLKKRIRDADINELQHRPNRSFIEALKRSQVKKNIEAQKPQQKFILEQTKGNKPDTLEALLVNKPEVQEANNRSPTSDSIRKKDKKIKQKKPLKINQLPQDNLINLVFDKNAVKNIPLPPKKSASPKIIPSIPGKPKGNDQIQENNLLLVQENNIDQYMGDHTPAVEDDSNIDNQSNKSLDKDKLMKVDEDEAEDGSSIRDYYVDKKEIFDNTNLFNDDYSPEIKPFDDEDKLNEEIQNKNVVPNNNTTNNNNNETIIDNQVNKFTQKDTPIKCNNNIVEKRIEIGSESKGKLDRNTQKNDDDKVVVNNNRVVIPLNAFSNLNMNLNEENYLNQDSDNDNLHDEYDQGDIIRKGSLGKNNENQDDDPMTNNIQHNDKIKSSNKYNLNSLNTKKTNKRIDDDNKDYNHFNDYNEDMIEYQGKRSKINDDTGNNNSNINSYPLVTIQGTQIKLNLKLDSLKSLPTKQKNGDGNPVTSPLSSNSKIKERKMSTSSGKPSQIKPSTYSNLNNQPSQHINPIKAKNIMMKNNTQPQLHTINNTDNNNPNTTQVQSTDQAPFNQPPTLNHEIKKKEYDIVCLSMLDSLFKKMKTKFANSTGNTSSSSLINKSFESINKIITQLSTEDQTKRIRHITEKTMKILVILFDIFENEEKREIYLYDILQILDVINTFQHKTKLNYGSKIPQRFKLIKLCFKYISSLFRIKSYSLNQLKDLLNQNDSNNKTKNLIKFTKCYKSYMNSVEKLKTLLLKNETDDKKRKNQSDTLLIYLKTNANAIKYNKCFKVSKKIIEYIFDYLSSDKTKE